ncbi:hypothetical protein [Streptomyces werraensis]|uniref:hypothetical protein n=1 Tax=Streptomyces werraensis TaxID=68284 RepID=UPI00341D73D2
MSVYDTLISLWRTTVPVLAGWLAANLARVYIEIDEGSLQQGLVVAFTVAYYGLFRTLETKVSPAFGWLLGMARPPVYPARLDPVVQRYPKPPTPPTT